MRGRHIHETTVPRPPGRSGGHVREAEQPPDPPPLPSAAPPPLSTPSRDHGRSLPPRRPPESHAAGRHEPAAGAAMFLDSSIEAYLADDDESFYGLLRQINASEKARGVEYFRGLTRDRQDTLCSPGLNYLLAFALTQQASIASSCYATTRLAVCYICSVDRSYDTRSAQAAEDAHHNLTMLETRLGEEYASRLQRLLRSFDVYWRLLESLRGKLRDDRARFTVDDIRKYLLLRSSNTSLYCLLLDKTCGPAYHSRRPTIAKLLYITMILDDIRNDVLDVEADLRSGEPNLLLMMTRSDPAPTRGASPGSRRFLGPDGRISLARFLSHLDDTFEGIPMHDAYFRALGRFYRERQSDLREALHGIL